MEKDNKIKKETEKNDNSEPRFTILQVKRKRNEDITDSILLEERPIKYSKQLSDTIAAFSSFNLKPKAETRPTGRKLFRFFATGNDKQSQELLSGQALAHRISMIRQSQQTVLPKQQRITIQQNNAKKARFLTVNKIRKLEHKTHKGNSLGYNLFELIPQEEKKPRSTIILDDIPKIVPSHEHDVLFDYYYLDENHDEAHDTTIVPVESFSEINEEYILTYENEYDEDLGEGSSDSQNLVDDYPETPDDENEPWKDDTSEDKEGDTSSDESRGYGTNKFKHGYALDSAEEYDQYI
jgi:hypothetical protein